MNRTLDIVVVGYGIAGIAAAIHLRRLGHHVEHIERATDRPTGGAGVLLHPPALALLSDHGLLPSVMELGSPVTRLQANCVSGRPIMDFGYADREPGAFGLGVQRRALVHLLRGRDAVSDRVCFGQPVASVDPDRGLLTLANGSARGPYDLIVAADGADSAIRKVLPALVSRDRLYGWAALACLVDDPTSLVGPWVSQYFDGVQHVSVWPVGASGPLEQRKVNVSIKVSLSRAREFAESGDWHRVAIRLCPALIPLLGEARPPDFPLCLFSYRDVVLRRYATGRVVFLGDAAHSMSPQLGQGIQLALHDAATLARALETSPDPASACRRFDATQRALIPPIQRACRRLTPLFQSNSRILASLRDVATSRFLRFRAVQKRLHALLANGHSDQALHELHRSWPAPVISRMFVRYASRARVFHPDGGSL